MTHRRPDWKTVTTAVLIALSAVILIGAYTTQVVAYNNLFDLYEKQDAQLKANGIKPTTPSPAQIAQQGAPGATGDKGSTGATGDTGAQGYPGPEGIQGPPGIDGQTGVTGAAGANGAESTTPGPQGPSGANGANGLNGTDGRDGRGISTVECILEPDLTTAFRFTFTDTTTQDVPASCTPPIGATP